MKKLTKFTIRLLIFLTLLFAVIFGFFRVWEWMVVKRIAAQFQVTPSWDAIRTHLYSEEFKPGMTREEIHQVLDKVGSWEIRWYEDPKKDEGRWDINTEQLVFREVVRFTEIATLKLENLGAWSFTYDKNGRLVEQHRLDSGG